MSCFSHHARHTDCSPRQNANIFKQLIDIFEFTYHRYVPSIKRSYCYEIKLTHDDEKRLSNPELFYEEKCLQNEFSYSQKRPYLGSNLTTPIYIGDKVEKEEDPLGLSSSFSSLCSLSPQESKTDFVATEKTDITTTMQSEEMPMPYPKEGSISHPAKNAFEEDYLTAEQENEHYGKYRSRNSSSNQPISLLQVLANMQDIPIYANQNKRN